MNYLVLIENYYPIKEPTAKLFDRFINDEINKDNNFFIVAKSEKTQTITKNNIKAYLFYNKYSLKNGNIGNKIHTFFYKIIKKMYKLFYPDDIYDCHSFYRLSKTIIKQYHIDKIIAVAGWFSSFQCAYLINKHYHKDYSLLYCDPFINRLGSNYSICKLMKIERKWLDNAKIVIMPESYYETYEKCYSKEQIAKFKIINSLPCYFSLEELALINQETPKKLILYFGMLDYRIDSITELLPLAKIFPDYEIQFLSRDKGESIENMSVLPRLENEALLSRIGQASILLVIDNKCGIQIPSKIYECMSTDKIILLIYFNEDSPTIKLCKDNPKIILIKYEDIKFGNLNWLKLEIEKARKAKNNNQYSNSPIYKEIKSVI